MKKAWICFEIWHNSESQMRIEEQYRFGEYFEHQEGESMRYF